MVRGSYGFNPDKSGWLYQIKFDLGRGALAYKIGITNHSVEKRVKSMNISNGVRYEIIHAEWHENGSDARKKEILLLSKGRELGCIYDGEQFLSSGKTELFWSPLI
jgi:hypothetical protein